MPIVKVWNDNVHAHKESFKGTDLVIPAKDFIEMEYEEAIEFKGQYTPMPPSEFNGDIAKFYKMIRVETPPPESVVPNDDGMMCHANGKKAANAQELMAMLSDFAGLRVKDPEAEKAAAAKADEVSALRAQVAELTALVKQTVESRGPGRPRKEA